jgi:hypothetical protein
VLKYLEEIAQVDCPRCKLFNHVFFLEIVFRSVKIGLQILYQVRNDQVCFW